MAGRVILWGGTGQAKVLREVVGHQGAEVVAVFDNNPSVSSPFPDVPLLHGLAALDRFVAGQAPGLGFLVAIGGERGRVRCEIHEQLKGRGLTPLSAVHPTAFVAANALLGEGAQVLPGALVCVEARLGKSVIVNTGAQVDHECVLGDGVHLCPGVKLAGCVEIGPWATLGTGAVVLPRVKIGEGAVVGAGAVVTRDVADYQVVVGVPARAVGARPR